MANYLYNGIELPQLPEWDKTTYPYCAIADIENTGEYCLLLFDKESVETPLTKAVVTDDGAFSRLKTFSGFALIDGEWVEQTQVVGKYRYVKWANYDVKTGTDSDAAVYLAASDPVPVSVLTARDLYRKINGKPTKLTLYKKINGLLKQIQLNERDIT